MNRELHARNQELDYLIEYMVEIYFNGMINQNLRISVASDEILQQILLFNVQIT